MLDYYFSWYLGNLLDRAIATIKYWCLFLVLMLEDKHGLGVGGIDRVLIVGIFIINFPFYP